MLNPSCVFYFFYNELYSEVQSSAEEKTCRYFCEVLLVHR